MCLQGHPGSAQPDRRGQAGGSGPAAREQGQEERKEPQVVPREA